MAQSTVTAPKLLVIGGTGTTGSEVCKLLVARGIGVRATARTAAKAAALAAVGCEAVIADLAVPATLDAALADIQKVLLLSSDDPDQVRLQGNLVQAAQRAGVQHIVKVSAHCAGLEPPVSVGRWHAATEQQIRESGLTWTFLRPHFFMQNFLGFAQTIVPRRVFYAPMGDAVVSMVDARDLAAVVAQVLIDEGHTGQIYTVSGPAALSFREAAQHLEAATGQPVIYVDLPLGAARQAIMSGGMPDWFADVLVELYTVLRQGVQAEVTGVVATVGNVLPRSFAQFAQDHSTAFRTPVAAH